MDDFDIFTPVLSLPVTSSREGEKENKFFEVHNAVG